MAGIADLIAKQVAGAASNVQIPSNVKDKVLGGLGESVLGSLTQTVAQPNGVDQIMALVSGKTAAAKSPVTALAGNLFSTNVLNKLNLGGDLKTKLAALVPTVMGSMSNIIKDQDGDGDIDFQDLILTLKGGSGKSGLLGMASGLLGGLFKK